jgi:hypothetical protein
MRLGLSAFMVIIACTSAASSATPTVTLLKGSGTLTVRGHASPVDTVIYGASDGKVLFQVPTTSGAVGFSGTEDMQPTANQYILKVSSVYNGRFGASDNTRTIAEGLCELDISEDGNVVREMKCSATTSFGEIKLIFSGRRVDGEE